MNIDDYGSLLWMGSHNCYILKMRCEYYLTYCDRLGTRIALGGEVKPKSKFNDEKIFTLRVDSDTCISLYYRLLGAGQVEP